MTFDEWYEEHGYGYITVRGACKEAWDAAIASPHEASSEEWKNDYRTLYHELLYAVGNKYPGETRHQTAKRYILQAEQRGDCKRP